MTLKQYLAVMSVGTLIGLGVFFLALFTIDPQTAGLVGLVIFYASLLLSFLGLFSTLGLIARIWVMKQDEPPFRQVKKTFRHGAFLSTLIVLALVFQSQRYLKWWTVALLIMIFTLMEMMTLTRVKRQ